MNMQVINVGIGIAKTATLGNDVVMILFFIFTLSFIFQYIYI